MIIKLNLTLACIQLGPHFRMRGGGVCSQASLKYLKHRNDVFFFRYPYQVKKVKDVVRNLDSQVKTGVLSWTM